MRRLTLRQAQTCETAHGPRCRCRCGGLLHGRGLMSEGEIMSLPEEDPHHAQPPRPRRQREREQQEAAGQMALIPLDPWRVEKNVCGFCMEDIHGTLMGIAGGPPTKMVWTHVASGHERCPGRDTFATPANLAAR